MNPEKEKIEFTYFFLGFFSDFIQDVDTKRGGIATLLEDNEI